MKVLSVIGTRPEAIKMAPVLKELAQRRADGIDSRLCVTGQHREMLDQVLACFRLRADIDLDVMQPRQSPALVTASILARLTQVIAADVPDWVLVHGDTCTTVAAALAGFYAGSKVAHVEAGLRTGNLRGPFPEEGHRRLTTSISTCHFAPTAGSRRNLLAEGVPAARIVVTGNTVIDALQQIASTAQSDTTFDRFFAANQRVLLVTMHRRESQGAPMRRVCAALRQLAARYGSRIRIVVQVHPNPAVKGLIEQELQGIAGIDLVQPMSYVPFIGLLHRCHLVMTDSGGLQEEAASLGKPLIVLRTETERPEILDSGCGLLVGTATDVILSATCRWLDDDDCYAAAARPTPAFGCGRAAATIVDTLLRLEAARPRPAASGAVQLS